MMHGCYTQLKNQADDALSAGCIFKRYNNFFCNLHMNVCSLNICFSVAFVVVVVVVFVVVCLFVFLIRSNQCRFSVFVFYMYS